MQNIQFISVTPSELQNQITEAIKKHLDDFLKNFKPKTPNDYLTRAEIAAMFKVNMSTVHNWSKSGRLRPYLMSGRVYYLRSEVEASVKPLDV